jgi:hypothetical protein
MTAELVKDERSWTLKLGGACDVFDIATLYAEARAAAEAPCPVAVSLHAVEGLDTAATQVLLALRQALVSRGLEARFDGMPAAAAERWRQLGVDIARG